MYKVLEVNVDDLHSGGVYALVKNVIINKKTNTVIDIAAIEPFVNPDNISMLKEHGSNVHYVGYEGSKWKKQFVCYSKLKKILENDCYDCVHIHADVANKFIASGLAAKKTGVKKIILHSHATEVDGNHRVLKRVIHKACRLFLNYIATDFVACSELAGEWMYPDCKNVKIINNGVDIDKFCYNIQTRDKIRAQLDLEDNFVIGHVGRFAYQKNHGYILRIAQECKKEAINVRFLLIGEGPDEQFIRKLSGKMGLDDIITFYGTSNKVNELFQAMDVFILPSHFEGLPIVGVEAQASGLPVIFSDKITREAKLLPSTVYLPIDDSNIIAWVEQIKKYMRYSRKDTSTEIKKAKFQIQDTVTSFLNLYK